jgi:PAS domain S-box-containing protein
MKNKDEKTEISINELLELKQAKHYLETIMDSSMDLIVLTDSTGYIVSVNKYFTKLLDYKQDEVIGEHISDFGPTVDKTYNCTTGESVYISQKYFEDRREMYDRFVNKQKSSNWQSYFVSKQDMLIPVEHNMSFFYDKKGDVLGAIAIIRDITKRSKTIKELQEAKNFLELIFKTSVDGLLVVDSQGNITMVNNALGDIFGYSKDELVGKTTSVLRPVGEEFSEEGRAFVEKLFDEGLVQGSERIGKKKDGTLINLEINSVLLNDTKGNYLGRLASYKDITKRKKSEEALLESEEKYKGVVSNVGIGIALISPNMEILSLNNQMQQWFPEADASENPICYRTFNNPPRENICSYCPTFKTLKDGQIHESITDTPQGDKITNYRIVSSPLKDKEGKITSAIEMVEDITERKVAQEKLLNYQKQLKALTSQITLSEEKERRRFAEYLHDEIGQYLFASQMQLKLLKDSLIPAKQVKTVDKVLNNIEQMIDKSRFLTFELASPVLYELGLEKALEWLAEHIHKQYNLVVSLEDDKQEKPLDDDIKIFLYRAVSELLTNVVKHAQTKKAIVSIQKDNSKIRISVVDYGVGINSSHNHFFDDKNEGFGLFLINERLEQLGGQVEIESQPNRGTHVTLVAPLSSSG